MIVSPYRYVQPHPYDRYSNTSPRGQQVWGILGDSLAIGTSSAPGPTPTAGTVYEYDGSSIIEVGATDLSNANTGSPWPRFGIDYNAAHGLKPVFVNCANGGAEFYPNGDNNNWYTSGTLYAAAKTKIDNALLAAEVLSPRGILVILGINDVRGAQALADVSTGVTSLITRLNTDYGHPNIYFALPGRSETAGVAGYNSNRHQYVRRLLLNAIGTYTNVHVVCSVLPFANWGLYGADLLHLTQTGNNVLGGLFARYANDSDSDRIYKTIISGLRDEVNSTKKAAIKTFVNTFSDYFQTVDALHIYVADTHDNALVDWGMIAAPFEVGSPTFHANSDIETDGSSSYIRPLILQDNTARSGATDFVEFATTKTVTTGSGTSAFLFGKQISSVLSRIYQGGSVLTCQVLDGTGHTSAVDAKFADNTLYAIQRISTTKKMKKDATDLVSVTFAGTGTLATIDTWIGCSNNNGTLSAPIQAQYKAYGMMKASNISSWSTFVSALNTLLTALAIP